MWGSLTFRVEKDSKMLPPVLENVKTTGEAKRSVGCMMPERKREDPSDSLDNVTTY